MALVGAINGFHVALAIHVATVIATFGAVFARPLVFAVASRQDPRSLPVLHRIEYTVQRVLVAPGVLVVVLTGIYMADKDGRWSLFYVWWGVGVVMLIAVAMAAVTIPAAKRAETIARRDLRAGAESAVELSGEYHALTRRLAVVSSVLGLFVLSTMLFMGLERPL